MGDTTTGGKYLGFVTDFIIVRVSFRSKVLSYFELFIVPVRQKLNYHHPRATFLKEIRTLQPLPSRNPFSSTRGF